MALSTTYFDPLYHYPPIPKFCITNSSFFSSKHTVPVIIDAHCAKFFFYTTWVRGVAYQKPHSGPKLMGSGLGEHVKIWDPLFISATVEAGNFKFGMQLGLGEKLAKKQLLGHNWQGSWLGSIPQKICDLRIYFCSH